MTPTDQTDPVGKIVAFIRAASAEKAAKPADNLQDHALRYEAVLTLDRVAVCIERGDWKSFKAPPTVAGTDEPAKTEHNLRWFVQKVVDTFKTDEAQGYRSKDRTYAIEMLEKGLELDEPR